MQLLEGKACRHHDYQDYPGGERYIMYETISDCVELSGVGSLELNLTHFELEPLQPGDQVGAHCLVLARPGLGWGRVVDVLQSHSDVVRQLQGREIF